MKNRRLYFIITLILLVIMGVLTYTDTHAAEPETEDTYMEYVLGDVIFNPDTNELSVQAMITNKIQDEIFYPCGYSARLYWKPDKHSNVDYELNYESYFRTSDDEEYRKDFYDYRILPDETIDVLFVIRVGDEAAEYICDLLYKDHEWDAEETFGEPNEMLNLEINCWTYSYYDIDIHEIIELTEEL